MVLQMKDNIKREEHKYHVVAWWASGRTGIAKSDSAFNAIHFTAPPKFGGLEGRWTPEDLLLCSLASCFTATFHAIAGGAKFDYTDLEVDAEGAVRRGDAGYNFSEIILRPSLQISREQDPGRALELLHKAKMRCLVSCALTIPQKYEMQVNISELSSAPESNPSPVLVPQPSASHYPCPWTMKDGTDVILRAICADDEPGLAKFHETLSDRTVYFRYFQSISLKSRVAHERLARICFADSDRQIVLVADYLDPGTGEHKILGIGRLNKLPETKAGEFAVLVSDKYQHRGLGTELLRRLVQIAQDQKLGRVSGEMLRENLVMQRLVKKLGFSLSLMNDLGSTKASLDL
jgi:organic hydroperoxide reductase OsmC/OhrA/RimJ/RimL family protein N-acetyltransferase